MKKTLDQVISDMRSYKDKVATQDQIDGVKERLKYFREAIKRDLPELTEEEVLKFHRNFYAFQKLFGWKESEDFFFLMAIKNPE